LTCSLFFFGFISFARAPLSGRRTDAVPFRMSRSYGEVFCKGHTAGDKAFRIFGNKKDLSAAPTHFYAALHPHFLFYHIFIINAIVMKNFYLKSTRFEKIRNIMQNFGVF